MSDIPRDKLLRLINAMGRPPSLEHGPSFDEVFGPFEFEGEAFYRYYDASTCIWQLRRAIPIEQRRAWLFPAHPSPDDHPEDVTAANALNFMPTPALPEHFASGSHRGPFWHKGRRFFWVLPSLSDGWMLALSVGPDDDTNAAVVRLFDRTPCDAEVAT